LKPNTENGTSTDNIEILASCLTKFGKGSAIFNPFKI